MNNAITIETTIQADLQTVWDSFTQPQHITNWNFASPDWHCPQATNDPTPNGKFSWRMEAKDGSMAFDYSGTYTQVTPQKSIHLTLDDNRKVEISFQQQDQAILVTESFEIEDQNSAELQKQGWQAILNNFKTYTESLS